MSACTDYQHIADAAKALEALHAIQPDIHHDEWVKVGMAFQAAGGDFDAFDQWSAGGGNYDAKECRSMWRSIKPGKGIGTGTLVKIAQEHGWSADHRGAVRSMPPRAPTPARPVAKPKSPRYRPGMSPAEVWGRCQPATHQHPYIQAKGAAGVPLDGLRVVPEGDPLIVAGNHMAGALVVPAYAPDRKLQSLQLIPPPERGRKLNLPDAPMAGALFTVGTTEPGGVVYVCEGIGAAWACWQATGRAAVACFGWGNVGAVAMSLRASDGAASIVLVPDVGKEDGALKIAAEVGARVALLPDGDVSNFDVNDYAKREGADALAVLLEQAEPPPKPEPLLKTVSLSDLLTNPPKPPEFVWAGRVPRGTSTLFAAHGGTGKSTIALMFAVSVATGRSLFGVETLRGNAVFVSLEDGPEVVRHRLASLCSAWQIKPDDLSGLLVLDGTHHPELYAPHGPGLATSSVAAQTPSFTELKRSAQANGALLIVIDNASDAFAGDEIKRVQVRAFIRSLNELATSCNAAVLLLTHVDKGTSRGRSTSAGADNEGYSGSTAWHNSVRSRLFMSRVDADFLAIEHQKGNLSAGLMDVLRLHWPPGQAFPTLADDGPTVLQPAGAAFTNRVQGRRDDEKAAAVLALIAEFEGREQYASPAPQARNNVFNLLKVEPAFERLKLNKDATARIVNQCQRAGWIEPLEYKSAHTRKYCQRWSVTSTGRDFAGLPAPTAPTCTHIDVSAPGEQGACGGAPTAPTYEGGYRGRERTHVGALSGDDSDQTGRAEA